MHMPQSNLDMNKYSDSLQLKVLNIITKDFTWLFEWLAEDS